MPAEPTHETMDTERLSLYLKALANPRRLDLLRILRVPTSSADITLTPRRRDEGLSQSRPMSRQAVEEHLQSLEEVGVVERLPDDGARANLRVLSQPRLFAIVEELRALTALRPAVGVDVDATLAAADDAVAAWPAGPKLVLTAGPWEGRAFALAGQGPWMIGRSREHTLALTYDPYVSAEHARVHREGAGYTVEALPGARNPVRVNFRPLVRGERRTMRAGDMLSVGRSMFVLQSE